MAGEKLLQIIKDMGKIPLGESTDLVFGKVISESPLIIRIDNKLDITEEFIVLSALVRETIIEIPYRTTDPLGPDIADDITCDDSETCSGVGGSGGYVGTNHKRHNHVIPEHYTEETDNHKHKILARVTLDSLPKILLWRGLRVGDVVRMLSVNRGQLYFVLEREEGIT